MDLIEDILRNFLDKNEGIRDRGIFVPLGKDVIKIKVDLIQKFSGEYKVYKSDSFMKDMPKYANQSIRQFLYSIDISDLPRH